MKHIKLKQWIRKHDEDYSEIDLDVFSNRELVTLKKEIILRKKQRKHRIKPVEFVLSY